MYECMSHPLKQRRDELKKVKALGLSASLEEAPHFFGIMCWNRFASYATDIVLQLFEFCCSLLKRNVIDSPPPVHLSHASNSSSSSYSVVQGSEKCIFVCRSGNINKEIGGPNVRCPSVHMSKCPHVQMSKCPNAQMSKCPVPNSANFWFPIFSLNRSALLTQQLYTLHIVQRTPHIVQGIQCTQYCVQCTVHSVKCTLYSVQRWSLGPSKTVVSYLQWQRQPVAAV